MIPMNRRVLVFCLSAALILLIFKLPNVKIVIEPVILDGVGQAINGRVSLGTDEKVEVNSLGEQNECYCKSSISRNKVDAIGGWNYNEVTIKSHHVWFDSGLGQEILRVVLKNTPEKANGGKPTVGDIGAGVGQFGAWLIDQGNTSIEWNGFDGGSNVNEFCGKSVALIDRDPYLVPKVCFLDASVSVNPKDLKNDGAPFDWVMSIEVAEHIPAEYQLVFVDNLIRLSKHGIIMSWAVPGQGGHGHVNEKSNDDVVEMMRLRNMYYLPNESANIRKKVDRLPWLKNTVMVFTKYEGKDAPSQI